LSIQIDIVLPCYNPNQNWQESLLDAHTYLDERYNVNYIVVNDGTENNFISNQIAQLKSNNVPIQLINYSPNQGKGYALRQGVSKATAPLILYTDIDFPFTNHSLDSIIKALLSNELDVVVGFRSQNYYQMKMSWFRRWLSKSFRFFIKHFLNMDITDTQCGLKGFNLKGKEKFLQTTINRYLFDFEFIYMVSNDNQIKMKAIEVELKENVKFSTMHPKILLQEAFNLSKILLGRKKK
jgi:glycosyltransferase involved in cell wall biosynthesis